MGQERIGLAWMISSAHDREIVGHGGATGGFSSWVGYDPKERNGVVALANAYTSIGVLDLGMHLLDPEWPLADPEPPKQRNETHIDPKLLDNYTGSYQVTPDLILEVTRDADHLFAQCFAQIKGQAIVLPKFELFAESEKKFFARVSDHQITFETGSDDRATDLVLHRGGREPVLAPRLS